MAVIVPIEGIIRHAWKVQNSPISPCVVRPLPNGSDFALGESLPIFIGCGAFPEGPCTEIVYTLAPKYLYRDYFKAKVYTIWVHGPLGFGSDPGLNGLLEDCVPRWLGFRV